MKKILLFMLPVMALSLASCEKNNGDNGELSGDDVIEFKDANFLKALLVVQETSIYDDETGDWIPYTMDVDVNKDGAITVNEARAVIGLVFFDYDKTSFYISEMPEIKYFTRLEYLNCDYNQLTSLDVSNNTALTVLLCSNSLTSLDVSNNTALTVLDCSSNQLTSLDVSNNTALTWLDCEDNELTSLDVSNNTALTGLDCSSNQLTSLDVSNNTALTELWCDGNQLTSLDLRNNTALTNLSCSGNPLTKIILSSNHSLEDYWIQEIINEYGDIIEYR